MWRLWIALGALLTACGATDLCEMDDARCARPRLAPTLYMREVVDKNPKIVGHFFSSGLRAEDLDDSKAGPTRCSVHIRYEDDEASMTRDDLVSASASVKGSLGLDGVGSASGGFTSNRRIAVHYKMTGVRRARIDDPEALARCCRDYPADCPGSYVGEVVRGTGEVFVEGDKGLEGGADGSHGRVAASLSGKFGGKWRHATTFDDGYFAFRPKAIPTATGSAVKSTGRPEWTSRVPHAEDGQFFVGVSDAGASEREVRSDAMLDARTQAVQYVAERIDSSRTRTSVNLGAEVRNEAKVQSAAAGLAELVKDRDWYVQEEVVPGRGTVYKAYVLAFLPRASLGAAEGVVLKQLSPNGATR